MNHDNEYGSVAEEYCRKLRGVFGSQLAGQPEDQLKGPVQQLLHDFGVIAGKKIVSKTESRLAGTLGRPDIGVEIDGLLCGYIELKAPGKGANPDRLRGADKKQWENFRSVPNLIYTDSSEWTLCRSGIQVATVRANGDVTIDGHFDETRLSQLRDLLLLFFAWTPIVPVSPQGLAELLAPLCKLLRHEVELAVAKPLSNLNQLAGEWRRYLFPDADDAQFADAYAQTLTYALLLARVSGEATLKIGRSADRIQDKHALLAQTLRVLGQEDARSELDLGISLLERCLEAVDLKKLSLKESELWLYFYEEFLSAYDPKLRRDRGVYYTPVEVVKAQVSIIADLLASRFGKRLSFADDGVFFLDPSVGTGAYPLAALKDGLERVRAHYGEGGVAGRASVMAKNLHAFEVLVGPYAVAHLRLASSIRGAGGVIPDSGLKVYLADTLESPNLKAPEQSSLFFKKLSEEHLRAQRVKSSTRILVCMGNPPYDRQAADPTGSSTEEKKGGWIRFGDHGNDGILNDFLVPLRDAGATLHAKNLYNDYVYFWRWALWKVFELNNSSGIVSFITASSYLRGPGFLGMRRMMRELLDELWIIDLEGGAVGPRPTENVFNIRTPVAIAVGVRYGSPDRSVPAKVYYSRSVGTREAKLEQLANVSSLGSLTWEPCHQEWNSPFLPKREGNFYDWPLVTDLFPLVYSGVQFKRSWPIGETRELLIARWNRLLGQATENRSEYLRQTDARLVSGRYSDIFDPSLTLPAIALLPADAAPLAPIRYGFRSFDRQWVLPDNRLCDRPRPPLWHAYGERQVFIVSLLTDILGPGPSATLTPYVPDLHYFRGSFGGANVIPLWNDSNGTVPNITSGLLALLETQFGASVSAEDFFAYAYAILASPQYGAIFTAELSEPGPRLPITKDLELFRMTSEIGSRLIFLHSYGDRFENRRGDQEVSGQCRCEVGVSEVADSYPDSYRFDTHEKALYVGTGKFAPVSEEIWSFSVSGLPVLGSWLRYRMKRGFGRNSSPLDDLRPVCWTTELSEELVLLVWILEHTLGFYPRLEALLSQILGTATWDSHELPRNQREGTHLGMQSELDL